jgi:hypothetical protein
MRKYLLPLLFVLLAPALAVAQSATVSEVTETILENSRYVTENNTSRPDTYSSEGALEFWSSGGLLNEVTNRDTDEYEFVNIAPKHITVIPIVEGQVAVAHYYSEGAMQPKGFAGVSHYMTRASQVYVKEGERWVIRSSHWSPVAAGSGTSQTVQ